MLIFQHFYSNTKSEWCQKRRKQKPRLVVGTSGREPHMLYKMQSVSALLT